MCPLLCHCYYCATTTTVPPLLLCHYYYCATTTTVPLLLLCHCHSNKNCYRHYQRLIILSTFSHPLIASNKPTWTLDRSWCLWELGWASELIWRQNGEPWPCRCAGSRSATAGWWTCCTPGETMSNWSTIVAQIWKCINLNHCPTKLVRINVVRI